MLPKISQLDDGEGQQSFVKTWTTKKFCPHGRGARLQKNPVTDGPTLQPQLINFLRSGETKINSKLSIN